MKAEAVLFDKDGTLIEFATTYGPALDRIMLDLARGDRDRADWLSGGLGYDRMTGAFHPASPVIAGTAEDMAVILSPRLGFADIGELARDIDEGFLRHSRDTLTTVPGTHSVLGALASVGLPLGLATNDGEANAQAHLDAAGMAGYFGFVAGHDSGHGAKPGPGMVRAFARLVGVEAGAVAMVGDTETDIQAARSAGAIAIVVTREAERIGADLDALVASADHAIATLEDLPDLLGLTR